MIGCPASFTHAPAIVNEYTYMTLWWETNNPISVYPGSAFVLPNSVVSVTDTECGLDSYDVDSFTELDYDEDITTILARDNKTFSTVGTVNKFNVTADAFGTGDQTDWVILSPCGWSATNPVGGAITLSTGQSVTFMDHRITLNSASTGSPSSAVVKIEYIGNCHDVGPITCDMGPITVLQNEVRAAGAATTASITFGSAESLNYTHPWYVIPTSISSGIASFNIGRLFQENESMFVDGMQYDIAAIYGSTNTTFKYITIRNPVLKEPVSFGCPGTCLCGYDVNDMLDMLPPFDRTHDIIDDIDIPNIGTGSDTFFKDNQGVSGSATVYYRGAGSAPLAWKIV